jgi:hypothetical protein
VGEPFLSRPVVHGAWCGDGGFKMVKEQGATLQAIRYAPGSLELLDQRLLPTQSVFLPVPTTAVAFDHIKDMVRYRC